MLVRMDKLTKVDASAGYGIAAPCPLDFECVHWCFETALTLNAPFIMCYHAWKNYGMSAEELADAVKFYAAKYPQVPMGLCLDHGRSYEDAVRAIKAGFTAVMVDRSDLSDRENAAAILEAVKMAHAADVSVEAALGGAQTRDASLEQREETLMKVDEAAGGSKRLVAIIFGAVDYTRDMRVTRTDKADEQFYARARIGAAARAYGLVAEDAPFPNYSDVEAFEANCRSGAQLGFEGRQIINPRQIAPAPKVYSPDPARVEWAKKITKVFEEEGLAKGSASVGFEGSMIDIPVYRDGLNILARQQEIAENEARKAELMKNL